MKKFIAYYRVSRKEQGISGLGLSAQQSSVEKYVTSQDGIILKSFTEIETGTNKREPDVQLIDATKTAKPNELFEFVSNNSINEFSLTKFENGTNILGTSFKESSELSLNISASRNNGAIIGYDHSHPMDFDGIYPSPADIQTAGKFSPSVILRVYGPLLKQYKDYNSNSPSVELKEVLIPGRKSKK